MTDHPKELEVRWNELNRLMGFAKDLGARGLIAAHMDKIASEIGFPMTAPVMKENRDD
jgi:hypothetical protein